MNLSQVIKFAVEEDQPKGDITTDNLELGDRRIKAKLIAKEDLVLSGREPFAQSILEFDPAAELKWYFEDGQTVLKGQAVCVLKGSAAALLKGERIALNFLGHLSGIATFTKIFVQKISHTKTKILDTRKTTPLLRELEKKAVRDGGGQNHRMNLSESVMIKDNHIQACGNSVKEAILKIRKNSLHAAIEIECSNMAQIREASELKVKRIMLDNMNTEQMREALVVIPPWIETEASGNMTLDRIKNVAELGVHYISVGALTHSAPNADFSLQFEWTYL
jgi:nicotinate-nucleotide pyrophosphorylase (carboxylating)